MTVETHTIEVTRRVAARPETVFPFFTDEELLLQWQGTRAHVDARPGGHYEVRFAERARVRGEYLVVEPPHRLVYTWGWEGSMLEPFSEIPPGSSTVEITFEAEGDGTLVRVRHTRLVAERAREVHTVGWRIYLDRLAAAATGADPGPDPFPTLGAVIGSRGED